MRTVHHFYTVMFNCSCQLDLIKGYPDIASYVCEDVSGRDWHLN
jgi:hypothetical protein